ncbi:MAG: ExbD/TolR family protein [Gemmatimonadales bacterium]
MGMTVGEEGEHKAEPNVVPMIDVMLVLLIIFMIVTPIISAGFQAQMPLAKNVETREPEQSDITLGIDHRGRYYIDPVKLPNGEVRPGEIGPVCFAEVRSCDQKRELEQRLAEIYSTRTMDKILFFKADQNLPFGTIEDALAIARRSGVRVLAAVSDLKVEGGFFGEHR